MDNFLISYAPAICGILFTLGAIVISETGKIFIGSIIYLSADIVYLAYAWAIGDSLGMFFLLSGLLFGIRTLIKMNIGIFNKTLHKEQK